MTRRYYSGRSQFWAVVKTLENELSIGAIVGLFMRGALWLVNKTFNFFGGESWYPGIVIGIFLFIGIGCGILYIISKLKRRK